MAEVDSMIRVGVVSDVNASKGTARVFFPSMSNMVSDWLFIMRYPNMSVSISSNGGHTHDGEVVSDGSHSHSGSIKDWMPAVNDKVLVIYAFGFNSDGFILGVIQ